MLKRILRYFGYYKCDYGFATGRHYVIINGMVIADTPEDDFWLSENDVHRLGYCLFDHGEHWTVPPLLPRTAIRQAEG